VLFKLFFVVVASKFNKKSIVWTFFKGKKIYCEMLVSKITARIDSWLGRKLSFAGRLQLIIQSSIAFKCIGSVSLFFQRRLSN
jgi:hypothetical protein